MEFKIKLHLHTGFPLHPRLNFIFMKLLKTCLLLITLCLSIPYTLAQKPATMKNYDYEKAWKQVQDAENKALPETALKTVNEIYQQAKTENNAGQLAKAILHQLKYTQYKEEEAFAKNLQTLEKEAETAAFPVKPLLHSMLAELYWNYYQQNRWQFSQRTQTVNFDNNDLKTWSLEKIVDEVFLHYQLSLAEPEKAKATPVNVYLPVLQGGNDYGKSLRSTLYDFLAHRALGFYMGEEPDLTKPAYAFTLSDKAYLTDTRTFTSLPLASKDTLSLKFQALLLFQDILKFNLERLSQPKGTEALVFTELQRLQFVRQHLTVTGKDDLYLQALEKLEQTYLSQPVSTLISLQIAGVWQQRGASYRPLQSDAHKTDLRHAFDLAGNAIQRFPQSDGAVLLENLRQSLLFKSLSAQTEKVNLPGLPFLASVTYKNIGEVHWKIIPVSREEVLAQRKKYPNLYDYEEKERRFIQYFLAKTALKTGKSALPDDQDLNPHTAEIKLDGVPASDYMVIFSHAPDFKTTANGLAYTFTTVSGLAPVHRNRDDGTTDFYVLHRDSGEPLSGVRADVYLTRYNSTANRYDRVLQQTLLSDANGYLKVPFQHKSGSGYYDNYFSVDFSYQNDKYSMRDLEDESYYDGSIYQSKQTKPDTHKQTFFFLDRAIYRPGQTLYFKGLVIETDGKNPKIMPGYAIKVTFYDVNRQVVAEQELKTNEYGTFSGTFTAPSTGLTGQMYLQTADGSGSQYFSVEEYKRPKFEVTFNPMKGAFQLNETATATGQATAFSGASIDGAMVKYRVVRRAEFPYWWFWRRGYFPTSPEMEITHGETRTDATGKFTVDFKAIADESVDMTSEPTFTFTVYADVTDLNGETHSSQTYLSLGYKSLKINVVAENVNLAEMERLAGGDGKKITFSSTNLMGQPEPAAVVVKILKLKTPEKAFRKRLWERPDRFAMTKEEFYKTFPHDAYDDETNSLKWEVASQVLEQTFEAGKPQELVFYKTAGTGQYRIELSAKDKNGQAVQEIAFFNVFDTGSKTLDMPDLDAFRELKTLAEPGETASVLLGSSERVKVLYETEQDGKLLSQQWLTLQNEQRKMEIPVIESYRGNIGIHYAFVRHNRFYGGSTDITVPFTNKQLEVQFETFRNKLQPGEAEEWRLKITGKKADKVMAELVATLYDASLDVFRANYWYAHFFNSSSTRLGWDNELEQLAHFTGFDAKWNSYVFKSSNEPYYYELNWFGLERGGYFGRELRERASMAMDAAPSPSGGARMEKSKKVTKEESLLEGKVSGVVVKGVANEQKATISIDYEKPKPPTDFSDVKVRKNFNETAFFFPHLQTDENGSLVIKFTIPEALTRWKMLGFAHTKDLKSGYAFKELVTQKDLMVVPNPPRFFREGDKMTFSAKITSLSDQALAGNARLEFFDALTMQSVAILSSVAEQSFSLAPKQSTSVAWQLAIPEGLQAISYRLVAKAGNFSDGEELMIPVVTNRMLVTETLPLPIRGNQTRDFELTKLKESKTGGTLKSQRFTLEFTSNPAWYAVQALPYLMEYPYDCVEQTFSKYYANAIAAQIANSNPKIKRVFDTWRTIQPDALASNLEKNQELKSALLEETPWVLNAKDESQRKRNVALLFDLNRMAHEADRALDKIAKAQQSSGGFSWFPGFPEDRYMTQHIVTGLGHLDVMKVSAIRTNARTWKMTNRALDYLEREFVQDYQRLLDMAKQKQINLDDNHLGYLQIHFLYGWSYFKKDRPMSKMLEAALGYYQTQTKKYWTTQSIYMQGMLALATFRLGDTATPQAIVKSLSERALHSEELGMYWKLESGWYWYQAPIETQALLMEVYDEVANDKKAVEDMKVWLLKQKQTQDWKTTRATSEACFALLRRGTDVLASDALVQVQVGSEKVNPAGREDTKIEAGTGYFKTAWTASQITPDMGSIKVTNPNPTVAWGAVYWQYFENLDKITPAQTSLSLKKQLFLQQNSDKGIVLNPVGEKAALKVGDLITVRIELRVDRPMEYVHLKDMRAAAFEPVSTLSTHKFQDGLWYYESPRDLATNFFFGYLPKGTYVFEYPLRVSQQGDFSNGITTIQCMYAPEFTSHSAGIRVEVK